jgi:hypothetical protein
VRRIAIVLGVLGAAWLASCGVASAAPTVALQAAFDPIPGVPESGDILGAGASLQAEFEIAGTEYFGSPPPIIGIDVYLPKGTTVDPGGFPTCSEEVIKQYGPIRCPQGSKAGPVGTAEDYVTLGGERVEEASEIFSFYKPGGGFIFFTDGHSPVSLEVLSPGSFGNLDGAGGYGPELSSVAPLVASLPGAPFASLKTIDYRIGSAYSSAGNAVYYFTVPEECPAGGFRTKAEVIFAENGEESKPQAVTASYRLGCGTETRALPPQTAVPGTDGVITAPSNKVCLSRRDFPIHIQQIRGLTYRKVTVYVNGRRVDVVKKQRFTATVDLRGLPKGRYTVNITVLTTSGQRLTGTRAYHTCAPRPLPGGRPRL